MPGDNEPSGFILTTILGIVGAFVATYLGQALGWYRPGEGAGLIGAVVGAIIVLLIYGFIAGGRPIKPMMMVQSTLIRLLLMYENGFAVTAYALGSRPSGVYLSTAAGSSRESLERSSSCDRPVCCSSAASTSDPMTCLS
jgi:uncharacterized membrane protein YeaQ/YmgE (transglycosylase-associated protein family)